MMAALANWILHRTLIREQGKGSLLSQAVGTDVNISPLLYTDAIGMAGFATWLSVVIYTIVALMRLIPDRRIEKTISESEKTE